MFLLLEGLTLSLWTETKHLDGDQGSFDSLLNANKTPFKKKTAIQREEEEKQQFVTWRENNAAANVAVSANGCTMPVMSW